MKRTYHIPQIDASLTISLLDPDGPDAARLLALSDALLQSLYPAESNHLVSAVALRQDKVVFLGGAIAGEVVACGAAKMMDDDGIYAEIKRLFVIEGWRGHRIAERLMAALEHEMAVRGSSIFRLETGVSQPAALALYRRLGYRERPPFGAYRSDPLSVFMEKRIG